MDKKAPNKDFALFTKMLNQLYEASKRKLEFDQPIKIKMVKSHNNSLNPLGRTASYNPETKEVNLYFVGRHPKDLMRSFSHELVHHAQNCRGDLSGEHYAGEGYAQSDPHLREMEREAFEKGNMIFRDWEDEIKKEGIVPLFDNSSFATIEMGYNENLGEDKMSKKKLNESQLRNIIRGVIQEMFDEDMNEADNMGMPPNAEEQESQTADSQAADAAATITAAGEETGEDYQVQNEDSGEEEKGHYHDNETNDEEHIEAIRHHLDALEHDKDYDDRHEPLEEKELKESFLPEGSSLRTNARQMTYTTLLGKWCK